MISPGSTTGLRALASSLMLRTCDAAQLRDLVEVEVVGDDLSCQRARQLDQLEIDFLDVGKIDVGDDHVHAGHLLDLLQDVEAAAAAIALHRVRRVGDELQFLQHELRNDQRAVHEAGLAEIGDAAVDDDRRVENLVVALGPAARNSVISRAGSSHSPLRPPMTSPRYGKHQQDEAVQEGDALVA